MKETGKIIEIDSKQAVIEVNPEEKCSKCCSCGASKPRKVTVDICKVEGFSVGDDVEVEVNPGSMVKIYVIIYLVPLMVFMGVLILVYSTGNDPLVSFIAAFMATLITYLIIGFGFRKRHCLCPEVRRKKENTICK